MNFDFLHLNLDYLNKQADVSDWIVTFNNKIITPIAHYRDQSNLGAYGKHGYGLAVYNVTDLINKGLNTFTLNKTSGLTAVYPSSLLLLTNNEMVLVKLFI